MTVTISDRQNATEVIAKLRETLTRKQISDLLWINPTYVTTALHRTRKGDGYHCPPWAIIAILKYASRYVVHE